MARAILGRKRRAREASASCPRQAAWEEVGTRVRALLSVANRDGIVALARDLLALDVEVFATDGTREHLAADGIEVGSVSDLTGLPPSPEEVAAFLSDPKSNGLGVGIQYFALGGAFPSCNVADYAKA